MSYMDPPHGRPVDDPARFFLALLLQEVRANASEAEERSFLIAVGRDLAACCPLEGEGDMAALEASINRVWRMLDMGSARISTHEDAIHIHHKLPHAGVAHASDQWRAAVPAVLEGAYDAWLRALGSGPRLRTERISQTAELIEFRHGL
jgi:hypothetical protein